MRKLIKTTEWPAAVNAEGAFILKDPLPCSACGLNTSLTASYAIQGNKSWWVVCDFCVQGRTVEEVWSMVTAMQKPEEL